MKILLIYTGGTIGMIHSKKKDAYVPFDFDNLQNQIPELKHLDCSLEVLSYDPSIDSSNMQTEIWVQLAKTISSSYQDYEGFVILHGSDTMAFTASALSFMLEGLNKPVVLTGSQLPSGVPRTDAKENLITAIEIAASQRNGHPEVPEVSLYFEYQLYRGNRTHKSNAENFEAFESVNYPPLAEAGVHLKFNRRYIQKNTNESLTVHTKLNTRIGVLKLFPGMTPDYVKHLIENPHIEAFILETFGAGNAPTYPWFLKLIKIAIDSGKLIFNVSQCNGGSVDLGCYETSKSLKELGVLSAYDMTFEAAITKLMFVMGYTDKDEKRKALLETNLQGECSI
jgi:L-asparaginase